MSAITRRSCSPVWDVESEKIFTYLWYLGIFDAATLEHFTSKEDKQCTNKKAQYPQLSKYEDTQLLTNITNHTNVFKDIKAVYSFARQHFRKNSKKPFDEIAQTLTDQGIKSPDEVYEDWSEKYKDSPAELPSEAVTTFLSETHFSTKNVYYSWIYVEKRLYSEYRFDSVPYNLSDLFRSIKGKHMIKAAEVLVQFKC